MTTASKRPSVADIVGPWVDPDWNSGLIDRLRHAWNVPISELSNEMLATFLRQDIATTQILQEARDRLARGFDDDSEIYDGEFAAAVADTAERSAPEV